MQHLHHLLHSCSVHWRRGDHHLSPSALELVARFFFHEFQSELQPSQKISRRTEMSATVPKTNKIYQGQPFAVPRILIRKMYSALAHKHIADNCVLRITTSPSAYFSARELRAPSRGRKLVFAAAFLAPRPSASEALWQAVFEGPYHQ